MMAQEESFPVVTKTSATVARGYIRFVCLRPGKVTPGYWVCDECCERITPGNFEGHARGHR